MGFVNINKIFILILGLIFLVLVFGNGALFLYNFFRNKGKDKKFDKIKNFVMLKRNFRAVLEMGTIILISIVGLLLLLRPHLGEETIEGMSTNLDIAFVVDGSPSMNVKDCEGGSKSRLTKTQETIKHITQGRNDRNALITFSHKANIECPFTFDRQTFLTGVETIHVPEPRNARGTSVQVAFDETYKRLVADEDPLKQNRTQIVIFISDGEQIGDTSKYGENIQKLKKEGFKIYTVGVGTKSGGKVISYTDDSGKDYYEYMDGEDAISKMDESNLKKIANLGGGKYYHSRNIDALIKELDRLNSQKTKGGDNKVYKETYFAFAFVLIGIISVYHFEMYNIWRVKHKKQNHKRKKIFKFNALSPILVIPLFPILFLILSVSMSLGVADYKDQKYDKAKKHFQTASGLGADLNGRSFNNLGNTFYRLGQYQESAENYQKAIDAARKYGFKKHIAKYYYNLGNAYFRIGENEIEQNPQKTVEYWLQAIEFYKQALEYNPDDQEAQENIEYIKSLLENAQKEKDGKDGDKEGEEGEESEEEVNEKEMDDAIDKVTKEDKKNREDANDNRKYYEDGGGGSSDYDYDEPYW